MIIFILSVSVGTLYMMNCYREFMFWGLRLNYSNQTGHLQLAEKGYWGSYSETKPMIQAGEFEKLKSILDSIPGISRHSNQISFQGIGGTSEKSDIIIVEGVEASTYENRMGMLQVIEGRMITQEDEMSIVIGRPMAEKLNISTGDWLTIITTAADGSFTFGEAEVTGIITTGFDESDQYFGLANISFVQNLKGTDSVETIRIFLEDEDILDDVRNLILSKIDEAGLNLELKDWIELNPYYTQLDGMFRNMYFVVNIIVSLLVFLAVLEILSMSFFERFREIGSLRAIGNTRLEILQILIFESVFYALIGILSGFVFSHLFGMFINSLNIRWLPPGSTIKAPFKFLLEVRFALLPVIIVILASQIAAIIPAIKGARLQVIEVLKHE
jgi:putative ABC transport system permease protein